MDILLRCFREREGRRGLVEVRFVCMLLLPTSIRSAGGLCLCTPSALVPFDSRIAIPVTCSERIPSFEYGCCPIGRKPPETLLFILGLLGNGGEFKSIIFSVCSCGWDDECAGGPGKGGETKVASSSSSEGNLASGVESPPTGVGLGGRAGLGFQEEEAGWGAGDTDGRGEGVGLGASELDGLDAW